jgi:hypothetical protein
VDARELRYSPGPLPTDEVITLKLSPGRLILEGIRTIDSWGRIWEAVGPLEATYRTTERLETLVKDMTCLSRNGPAVALRTAGPPEGSLPALSGRRLRDLPVLWAAQTLGIVQRGSARD